MAIISERIKTCDVPQGSILGPNLYEDYTSVPLGDIFRKHGISFHIYADDTQAYLPFSTDDEEKALQQLEACLSEIRDWMAHNWLKLNDDKTEFIIFGAKDHVNSLQTSCITVGGDQIGSAKSVKSIGATLDSTLKLEQQIALTCKSAWYHLHQISRVKKYLSQDQIKTLVHAYVTSRLDQNNALLVGLPKKSLHPLQMVQNASARLIMGIKKHDHISPTLIELHWLPVEQRIIFKLLLLVYS